MMKGALELLNRANVRDQKRFARNEVVSPKFEKQAMCCQMCVPRSATEKAMPPPPLFFWPAAHDPSRNKVRPGNTPLSFSPLFVGVLFAFRGKAKGILMDPLLDKSLFDRLPTSTPRTLPKLAPYRQLLFRWITDYS
ncbi:hypothetical protein JTE90_000343 [Oedothorax gibbosus]|uniref:Uncharacterized protein n=1 Tax=Oedothorax gibbosus TaxID=931172 RepID=A0AAV6TZR0_9ARAC|nr:hypothetical protein JTE90_000343 [Oedothorax gibbosus]